MHKKMQLVLTLLCVSLAAAAFIEVNELADNILCTVQFADPTVTTSTLPYSICFAVPDVYHRPTFAVALKTSKAFEALQYR